MIRLLTANWEQRRLVLSVLALIVVLAAVLRLQGLTTGTLGQVESYVPGIHYPSGGVSAIDTRLTVKDTVAGVIFNDDDPNPIGYYVAMLEWTRAFGTSMLALRLPSALLGIASIVLVYVVGVLEEDVWTGLLAAALCALNGYLIYWSQIAKMYAMGCFFGLLASVFLLLVSRAARRQRLYQCLYAATTLAGLVTVVHFWLMLAAHVVWGLRGTLNRKSPGPGLLQTQLLTFMLGSPLLMLAMHQGQRSSYLSPDPFPTLVQFFQFGFLFVPDDFALPPRILPAGLSAAVLLLALALFGCGLGRKQPSVEALRGSVNGPSWAVMVAAGLLTFAIDLRVARYLYGSDPRRPVIVVAFGVVLALALLADALLRRRGDLLRQLGAYLGRRAPLLVSPNSLSVVVTIVPAAVLTAVSPIFPLFAPRTSLLFSPYLLVVVAAAVVALISLNRRWLITLPILAIAFSSSAIYNKTSLFEHPTDYQTLAREWVPEIKGSDLILVQRHWVLTPIFYYLQGDQYHFVARDYADAVRRHPDSRVWVLSLPGLPTPAEMTSAVADYQPVETLEARRIETVLYAPAGADRASLGR